MKRFLVMIVVMAILLTGCGWFGKKSEIVKIEIYESGGFYNRSNVWTISCVDGNNTIVFDGYSLGENRKITLTYNISDDDFKTIANFNFSKYIGKEDNHEGEDDYVDCWTKITYADGTTDRSGVYIPKLLDKIYEIESKYDPIESPTQKSEFEKDIGGLR